MVDNWVKQKIEYLSSKIKQLEKGGGGGTTPNNGKLSIKRNNVEVGTFTANQSSDTSVNITVPTKTSELTNDGNGTKPFLTDHQSLAGKQDKLTAGENITIENNVISATGGSSGGGIELVEKGEITYQELVNSYRRFLTDKATIYWLVVGSYDNVTYKGMQYEQNYTYLVSPDTGYYGKLACTKLNFGTSNPVSFSIACNADSSVTLTKKNANYNIKYALYKLV